MLLILISGHWIHRLTHYGKTNVDTWGVTKGGSLAVAAIVY